MSRPRKNPNDPKWNEDKEPVSNDWKMLFACALTGLISRGGMTEEQMIKTAKQYANEAIKAFE